MKCMVLRILTVAGAIAGLWTGQEGVGPRKGEKDKEKTEEQYIRVEVKGILRLGVAAIGGETTGTTITARGVTWELELGKEKDLRARAEKLDGKTAVVTGSLEVKRGVEIQRRWIVTVATLKPPEETDRRK